MLTRDQMLSHPPLLKTQIIPVPEFGDGEELAVRGLTALQRWKFGQMAAKAAEDDGVGPEPASYLITLAAVDGDGKTLFQGQDSDVIAEWPGDLVDRISTIVMEMSGLSPKGTDVAVVEAGKDSGPTPSVDSSSGSVESSGVPPTS